MCWGMGNLSQEGEWREFIRDGVVVWEWAYLTSQWLQGWRGADVITRPSVPMQSTRSRALAGHLIRIFYHYLHLLWDQSCLHTMPPSPFAALTHNLGRPMFKMAMFLGGFLVLTILIGALATISPV